MERIINLYKKLCHDNKNLIENEINLKLSIENGKNIYHVKKLKLNPYQRCGFQPIDGTNNEESEVLT